MKSKLESGDTLTRRVWLCEDSHDSVVGAVYVHVLQTLQQDSSYYVWAREFQNFVINMDVDGGEGEWSNICWSQSSQTWDSAGGEPSPRIGRPPLPLRYLPHKLDTSPASSMEMKPAMEGEKHVHANVGESRSQLKIPQKTVYLAVQMSHSSLWNDI